MDNIIVIEDLTFKYNEKTIFKKLNLKIEKGRFTTILGTNGSGKSTLVKLLIGLEKTDSTIIVNGLPVIPENLSKIRQYIGVVFENPDSSFVAETVIDELGFALENMMMSPEDIRKKIDKITELLGLKKILECEPHSLSLQNKQLVALASALIIEPKILIIDDGFSNLDNEQKEKVLKLIKILNMKDSITVINISNDIEDSLYGDDIVLLHGGKAALSGPKEEVFEHPEVFEEANLDLPFIIALSNKLKFYNLIDKTYFDTEMLVDDLWK